MLMQCAIYNMLHLRIIMKMIISRGHQRQTNLIDIFHFDKQFSKSNNNNVVDDWRHCKCKIPLKSNKFLSIHSIYGNWAIGTNHLSKYNLHFSWVLFWAKKSQVESAGTILQTITFYPLFRRLHVKHPIIANWFACFMV